jgi:hypothetical protein
MRIISRFTGANRSNRASPQYGSKPNSAETPLPPWVCIAASTEASAASAAAYSPCSMPRPRVAPVVKGSSAMRHERRQLRLDFGLGQGMRDNLVRADRPVPHLALSRVPGSEVQRVARDADAQRRAGDALRVEPVEDLAKALALVPDERRDRQPDAVEPQGELPLRKQHVHR